MKQRKIVLGFCALAIALLLLCIGASAEKGTFMGKSTATDVYIDSEKNVSNLTLYRAEYKDGELLDVKKQEISLSKGENHFAFEAGTENADKVRLFCLDSALRPYAKPLSLDGSEPVIALSSAEAVPGGTVEISVNIKNNPGIFGAILNFTFDENLTLTDATSGAAFSSLDMTKPGKLVSPCNFVWDGMDTPAAEDGEILSLTFTVSENVKVGDKLAVSCNYSDSGIVNSDFESVDIGIANGTITICDPCKGSHTAASAVKENEKAGTCITASTYDSVVYCSVCNAELSRQTVTGELGSHEFYNGKCKYCGAEQAITEPTIIVNSSSASAGETAEISVSVKNNPGIFGAILKFSYDSKLTLISASSGEAFANLDMTKPGKLVSPCNFVWDGMDNPAAEDGEILKLTFAVSEDAEVGENLAVECTYSDGEIVNSEFGGIDADIINGAVNIIQ